MVTVFICLGSACYVRGAEDVAARFEELIHERGLQDQVDLRGSLCMGNCSLGVSVRVGERVYHQVAPDNAKAFFLSEIAPLATASAVEPLADN